MVQVLALQVDFRAARVVECIDGFGILLNLYGLFIIYFIVAGVEGSPLTIAS